MTKLAIVDLDGVVADNTARFEVAEEAKKKFLEECRANPVVLNEDEDEKARFTKGKEATALYYQTAFTPELVNLDTLIAGAREAIATIEQLDNDSWNVIYLTSRPEHMREATYNWLLQNYINGPKLVMKAPAFQYVKTTTWKAGMVQTLAALYGATSVLFVDDEAANAEYVFNTWTYEPNIKLCVSPSLSQAVLDASNPTLDL